MTSEEKNYSPAFKKKVAREALDQSKQNVDKLSEKYDVPVSMILMWATELEKGGDEVFKEAAETEMPEHKAEKVDVEITTEEVASSVGHGAMFDNLNYKRLVFWTVLGIVMLLIIVQSLMQLFEFNKRSLQDRVSADSGEFYPARKQKREAQKKINSFGVVNLEEGIYRIPIDSVINNMAVDEE